VERYRFVVIDENKTNLINRDFLAIATMLPFAWPRAGGTNAAGRFGAERH
jgi:hypothetical protein